MIIIIFNTICIIIYPLLNTTTNAELHKYKQLLVHRASSRLIQLYAVCTQEEPIYIITELMKNGSLLEYLQVPLA